MQAACAMSRHTMASKYFTLTLHSHLLSWHVTCGCGHQGLMSQEDWDAASSAALRLFAFGQEKAATQGLLLVDTKYEFGRDVDGNVLLIDEVHTPDSSRYWLADSYEARFAAGQVFPWL